MTRHHYEVRFRVSAPSADDLDEQEIVDWIERVLLEDPIPPVRQEGDIEVVVIDTDMEE